MSDLTDFLLARIAEDEAFASEASCGPWEASRNREVLGGDPQRLIAHPRQATNARFIRRHNPARVLAECEAKRRIVEEATLGAAPDTDLWAQVAWDVLRLLALPYADHADYREEWRP